MSSNEETGMRCNMCGTEFEDYTGHLCASRCYMPAHWKPRITLTPSTHPPGMAFANLSTIEVDRVCSRCQLEFNIWKGHECTGEPFTGLDSLIPDGEIKCSDPDCANIIKADHVRFIIAHKDEQYCSDYCAESHGPLVEKKAGVPLAEYGPAVGPSQPPPPQTNGGRYLYGPFDEQKAIEEDGDNHVYDSPSYMTRGSLKELRDIPWICPRCDRVWGPGVEGCGVCNDSPK